MKLPFLCSSFAIQGENFQKRLDGFTLQLLDGNKTKVFERVAIGAPDSSVHILAKGKGKVAYLRAAD